MMQTITTEMYSRLNSCVAWLAVQARTDTGYAQRYMDVTDAAHARQWDMALRLAGVL